MAAGGRGRARCGLTWAVGDLNVLGPEGQRDSCWREALPPASRVEPGLAGFRQQQTQLVVRLRGGQLS